MKKLKNRFEVVPLAEVLKKGVEVESSQPVEIVEEQGPNGKEARKLSKRVLVVDDERCIADTLAAILRSSGYDATVAYDPQSAILQCESLSPELVISDVAMPGMNGVDMAILLRERHPDCKILLFSGHAASANLLKEARRRGHDFEILAKPIHPTELLAKVSRLDQSRPHPLRKRKEYDADAPGSTSDLFGLPSGKRPQGDSEFFTHQSG